MYHYKSCAICLVYMVISSSNVVEQSYLNQQQCKIQQNILPMGEIPHRKKNPAAENPRWYYLYSLSLKTTAESTSKPVFRLTFDFKNMFKYYIFNNFLTATGFFPRGDNTLWVFTSMGYVNLLRII